MNDDTLKFVVAVSVIGFFLWSRRRVQQERVTFQP